MSQRLTPEVLARRAKWGSHAGYLRYKEAQRLRLFRQGCTDSGEPLSDPAYKVWLASQVVAS